MKRVYIVISSLTTLVLLVGCNGQDNDQVAERARLEGRTQAEEQFKKDRELLEEQAKKDRELLAEQVRKDRELMEDQMKKQKGLQDDQIEKQRGLQDEQIRKERTATDTRAKDMEKALAKLQDFYEDNSGVYEGTMTRGADKFSIRITLSPSISRYSESRTRTLAEIEADLTALTFNAQIIQWIPPSKDSVGCRINGVKPNTKKGTLFIISPDCPSAYSLNLNRTTVSGTAQSETNPDVFEIYADRTSKPIREAAKPPVKKVGR